MEQAKRSWKTLNAVDMCVMTAGTGGTITGVAQRLKEANSKTVIVGVDPVGSILGGGTEVGTYLVEGIGYDFVPDVLDRQILVDTWVKTQDKESFQLARRLIREEGMLCGGSSGAALAGVLQEARKLKKGQNCVVILADGIRNYMTKFVDPELDAGTQVSVIGNLFGPTGGLIYHARALRFRNSLFGRRFVSRSVKRSMSGILPNPN